MGRLTRLLKLTGGEAKEIIKQSIVLKCEIFFKITDCVVLKLHKHSAFLFQSYDVALGIDETERYRWLQEILEGILSVLYMKKTSWSMNLSFQSMLYRSMFRLLEGNMIKKEIWKFSQKWGRTRKIVCVWRKWWSSWL